MAALDWVFTSRCAGRLVATARQVQAPIEELTSFSNNNIQTVSGKETAKCSVGDNVNVIFDSGLSRTTNSLGSLTVNDYDQYYLRGGLEYSLADLNTIGGQSHLHEFRLFQPLCPHDARALQRVSSRPNIRSICAGC